MLLFTHTCPVTEFAVASHLNTANSCCHHVFLRHFRFQKCLPMISNQKISISEFRILELAARTVALFSACAFRFLPSSPVMPFFFLFFLIISDSGGSPRTHRSRQTGTALPSALFQQPDRLIIITRASMPAPRLLPAPEPKCPDCTPSGDAKGQAFLNSSSASSSRPSAIKDSARLTWVVATSASLFSIF